MNFNTKLLLLTVTFNNLLTFYLDWLLTLTTDNFLSLFCPSISLPFLLTQSVVTLQIVFAAIFNYFGTPQEQLMNESDNPRPSQSESTVGLEPILNSQSSPVSLALRSARGDVKRSFLIAISQLKRVSPQFDTLTAWNSVSCRLVREGVFRTDADARTAFYFAFQGASLARFSSIWGDDISRLETEWLTADLDE